MKRIHYIVFSLLLVFNLSYASDKKIEIGIDEKLGSFIPLDAFFFDENGKQVSLKELISKPTILSFVYYNCPGICTPLMMEIADVVNKSDLIPGVDYNIINISMDEFETPDVALERKKIFTQVLEKNIPPESWSFLTGDSSQIRKVSNSAGFYFKRQGKDFLHSGALIFIDKEGKICRYLFPAYTEKKGFGISPFDLKMAVLETSEGKISPTIARVLQFCFSYDPEGKTYVLNLTRIFGAGILLLVAVFAIVFLRKPKKEKLNKG